MKSWRVIYLCWLGLCAVALAYCAVMLVSSIAKAEGELVMGTMPCDFGLDAVQFYVGGRFVAQVCMSAAELERAAYTAGRGAVACRVLHIRSGK